jgi:hypothetical protein
MTPEHLPFLQYIQRCALVQPHPLMAVAWASDSTLLLKVLQDSSACADVPAKAVQSSGVKVGSAKSTRWMPDSPIQAARELPKPQGLPESSVEGSAEEKASVGDHIGFAPPAASPVGGSAGQGLRTQGSMLPSESRKLAHLALQLKEPSQEVRGICCPQSLE